MRFGKGQLEDLGIGDSGFTGEGRGGERRNCLGDTYGNVPLNSCNSSTEPQPSDAIPTQLCTTKQILTGAHLAANRHGTHTAM